MKEKNLSNVTFVAIVVLARVASKNTLNQFMKERSHFNVISVITIVLESMF